MRSSRNRRHGADTTAPGGRGAGGGRPATMARMPPPLIPLRDLFDNPERAAARLSPDGTRLSWLAPRDGVLNVWVRDRAGGEAVPVTDDRDRGIRSYLWSRDSRRILYSQDVGGDENHHLLAVDADGGGSARDLTPYPGVRAGLIDAPRATPRHVLVSMNLRDRSLFDAYRLTLATGRLELIGRNPGNIIGWTADREGRLRAALAQTPGRRLRDPRPRRRGGRAARRGRVRQRGRRPPLRLHPRRLEAVGGERARQRPDAAGGARSGRRLGARDRPRRRGRPGGPGGERSHRRAPGCVLPARPRGAPRLRRAPGARLGARGGAATRATRASAGRTPRRRPSSSRSTTTATPARRTSSTARPARRSSSTARGRGSTPRPSPPCGRW